MRAFFITDVFITQRPQTQSSCISISRLCSLQFFLKACTPRSVSPPSSALHSLSSHCTSARFCVIISRGTVPHGWACVDEGDVEHPDSFPINPELGCSTKELTPQDCSILSSAMWLGSRGLGTRRTMQHPREPCRKRYWFKKKAL